VMLHEAHHEQRVCSLGLAIRGPNGRYHYGD
jgi:hypothetical protein